MALNHRGPRHETSGAASWMDCRHAARQIALELIRGGIEPHPGPGNPRVKAIICDGCGQFIQPGEVCQWHSCVEGAKRDAQLKEHKAAKDAAKALKAKAKALLSTAPVDEPPQQQPTPQQPVPPQQMPLQPRMWKCMFCPRTMPGIFMYIAHHFGSHSSEQLSSLTAEEWGAYGFTFCTMCCGVDLPDPNQEHDCNYRCEFCGCNGRQCGCVSIGRMSELLKQGASLDEAFHKFRSEGFPHWQCEQARQFAEDVGQGRMFVEQGAEGDEGFYDLPEDPTDGESYEEPLDTEPSHVVNCVSNSREDAAVRATLLNRVSNSWEDDAVRATTPQHTTETARQQQQQQLELQQQRQQQLEMQQQQQRQLELQQQQQRQLELQQQRQQQLEMQQQQAPQARTTQKIPPLAPTATGGQQHAPPARSTQKLPPAAPAPAATRDSTEGQPRLAAGPRKCPFCDHMQADRIGPQLCIHINTIHPPDKRSPATAAAMHEAGITICATCQEAIPDSTAGRNAHTAKGCATFTSRNTRVKEATRARTSTVRAVLSEAEEASRAQDQQQIRQKTNKELRDIDDDEYFGQRPRTARYLKRWNWSTWEEDCLTQCLRGYINDSLEGRLRKQFKFIQIVRQKLTKASGGGEGSSGGGNNSNKKYEAPLGGGGGVDNAEAAAKEALEEAEATANKQVNRIEALAEMGALSRAVQALQSTAKPRTVDDTCKEQLRRLHPTCPQIEGLDGLTQHTIQGIADEEVRAAVVQRLGRGAAPGLDGWTRELLLPIVYNREALKEFTMMITDFANGNTTEPIIARLMGCPLVALEKPDGGTRPIAIESAIIKLLSHIALGRVTAGAWKRAFPAHQYGAGPEASVERAVHEIRRKICDGNVGILVDCTNAYNTVSREAIFKELRANPDLWPVYRLAAWSLRHTRLSVMSNGVRAMGMQSESGVRQGSVLGPVLFSLAVQPVLNRINATSKAEADAYLDDITITSAHGTGHARATFDALERELDKIGLKVNRNKTVVLSSQTELVVPETPARYTVAAVPGLCQTDQVVKLLGAGACLKGVNAFPMLTAFVDQQMAKHDTFFQAIDRVDLASCTKMLLLRACGVGRPTFLIRTHPEECTVHAAAHFDAMLENSLKKIVGDDAQLDDIASLPCKMGGLGLRAVSNLTEIAYKARETGEQRLRTRTYEITKRVGVTAEMTDCDRDVMTSFAKVDTRNVRCSNEAFRMNCRERLFYPTAHESAVCRCGAPKTTAHVHTCTSLAGARYSRHDRVKLLLNKYAKIQFATRVEPSGLLQGGRGRPDLTVLMPSGDVHIDVSVTYMGAAKGKAIETREREKRTKYKELGTSFYPFIIGHTGELSKTAEEVLGFLIPHRAVRDEARVEIVREIVEGNLRLHQAAAA